MIFHVMFLLYFLLKMEEAFPFRHGTECRKATGVPSAPAALPVPKHSALSLLSTPQDIILLGRLLTHGNNEVTPAHVQ